LGTSTVLNLNRRAFLISTAATIAAGCATTGPDHEIGIVDTHTHFYDPSRPQGVPWPPKNDPVLYRTVLPSELKSIAKPLRVAGPVVVEASPRVEDNAWILDLAKSEPFILGLVGHLKPGQPNFARDLDRFAANRQFRGIRTGGWDIPLAPEKSDYVRDLRLLTERGLSLDVLGGPDDLPKIAQLAAAIPDLRIIINHCAGVHIDGKAPDEKWVAGIRQAAVHPRVLMKLSGLPEATGKEFSAPRDVEFYRPTIDLLWKEFGEDRLIFGSNWPVSARFVDYPTALAIVQAYFREKSPAARRKYFRTNAVKVYGVAA
jgi:L-fuconolactonase